MVQEAHFVGAASEKKIKRQETATGQGGKEFLKFLIENFDEVVLNYLDKGSRDAIREQLIVEDEKEFRRIKSSIENRILKLLQDRSSSPEPPNVAFFREIVGILATKYPYMFLDDPRKTVEGMGEVRKFTSRGSGGATGVSSLPKVLRQKFSRLLEEKNGVSKEKKRKTDLSDGSAERHAPPKKKKKVYGILSERYYSSPSEEKENFLSDLELAETDEEREDLFRKYRKDVQHILSTSVDMFSAVPGLFSSIAHVKEHFEWLTGKSIATKVNEELPKKLKLLRPVVLNMCSTKEFRLQLQIANIKGNELNGSYIPEYICLLRQLNFEWHKDRGGLFRFPAEPETASPHIFCSKGADTMKFSIHAEMKEVLGNLTFDEAVSAFFYICFIGNLEYPEAGEAVAIWLQRKVAELNSTGVKFNNSHTVTHTCNY